MTPGEKALVHQIHPLKLATDAASLGAALVLLWRGALVPGIVVALVPPAVASVLLMTRADLERWRDGALGRYVRSRMTPAMVLLRGSGAIVALVAAWFHAVAILAAGLVAIAYAWLRGLMLDSARTPGL